MLENFSTVRTCLVSITTTALRIAKIVIARNDSITSVNLFRTDSISHLYPTSHNSLLTLPRDLSVKNRAATSNHSSRGNLLVCRCTMGHWATDVLSGGQIQRF